MTDKSAKTDAACPSSAGERIDSIDVLRGVAVLGILALNIQSFSMPGATYMNPTANADWTGVNDWIWYVVHLLGDLKFWSIFSMLFGAGIVISTTRCEATGIALASAKIACSYGGSSCHEDDLHSFLSLKFR